MNSQKQIFTESGENVKTLPGYVYLGFVHNTEQGLALHKVWKTLRVIGPKDTSGTRENRELIDLAVKKEEWDDPKKYDNEKFSDSHPIKKLRGLIKEPAAPVRKRPSAKKETIPKPVLRPAISTVPTAPPVPVLKIEERPPAPPSSPIATEKQEDSDKVILFPKAGSEFSIKIIIWDNGRTVRVNDLFSLEKRQAELRPGVYGAKLTTLEHAAHILFDTTTSPLSFGVSLASLKQRMRPEAGYDITVKGLDETTDRP